MNGWIALLIAGCFEVGFTSFLKLSEGFTKWVFTVLFVIAATASFFFLSQAIKTLPMGTAYAVWTGLGAVGTAIVGMVFFKDPVTLPRILLLTVLLGSIIGLKFVSGESS